MTENINHFKIIGISHHLASVELREQFALSDTDVSIIHQHLADYTKGGFVLSTCNRTEIYCLASNPDSLITSWAELAQTEVDLLKQYLYMYEGKKAMDYLFRVGTGLDSQILGDFQIIGQIKNAYKRAIEDGSDNAKITRLIDVLLKTSKRVKNETELSSGVASMAYAAIQYVQQRFTDLTHKKALVYGAGKMGSAVVRKLAELMPNENILLANRTASRAQNVAEKYEVQNESGKSLQSLVAQADFLISTAASEQPIFTREQLTSVDLSDKIFVDLSMPRSIEPELKNFNQLHLINLDYLQDLQDETFQARKESVPMAEEIVAEELNDFYIWIEQREMTPTIHALKEKLHIIKEVEMQRMRKDNIAVDEAQIQQIADALINKVTTQCIKHVKRNNGRSLNLIQTIFELENIH